MSDPTFRLAEDALTLQSTAERLHDDSLDRACAPLVPAALTAIEHTLRSLSRTCFAAADAFVPPGGHDESIAERYARAAGEWPNARGGRGPSHEQQARVLSSLHDTGAALRAAAAYCDRASGSLAGTMDSVPEAHAARTTPSSVAVPTARRP
jgi:hypothetical protein